MFHEYELGVCEQGSCRGAKGSNVPGPREKRGPELGSHFTVCNGWRGLSEDFAPGVPKLSVSLYVRSRGVFYFMNLGKCVCFAVSRGVACCFALCPLLSGTVQRDGMWCWQCGAVHR